MLRKLILAATVAVGLIGGVAGAGQHYSLEKGPVKLEIIKEGQHYSIDSETFGQHYGYSR